MRRGRKRRWPPPGEVEAERAQLIRAGGLPGNGLSMHPRCGPGAAAGTTLFGSITPGPNNGTGNPGTLDGDLVIYVDSRTGGFNPTSTFTDTGNNGIDALRRAISGFDGNKRATSNFAPSFGADFAIGISPTAGQSGALFTHAVAANCPRPRARDGCSRQPKNSRVAGSE